MIDLENMTKEELIALLKAMSGDEDEKPYHPDSMIAMAMASPKEARAISWRMVHPGIKVMMCFVGILFLSIFAFILFAVLSP